MKNVRDHGYGDSPKVVGSPIVGEKIPQKCPACGCLGIFPVKVELADAPAALRRPSRPHQIIGNYIGCAACPWASAMMTSVVTLEPF